ncbi:MAG TPA: hypothetical protein VK540_12060 [Polyangiaceae bacterium]|jgi:hypothetical protein|nr:hypothetical protein [Polyangiaceae bacterium]
MRWNKTLWATVVVPVLVIGRALAPAGANAADKPAPPAASASASPAASASVGLKAAVTSPVSAVAAGPSSVSARPASSGGMDGATYAVRLRDLEQRIDELKEQIRRSHTRLSLLTDTILSGGLAGSRSEVQFQNDMSSAFKLVRALFVLDGAVQYNKSDDSGALAEQKEIPIFSGSIPPGDHTVQILLQFQGSGYGVFSYLKGYHFEARSSHSFTAVEGKTLTLQIIAYEKGGVTTPLEERPAVRFNEKIASGVSGQSAGGKPPAVSTTGNTTTGPGSVSTGMSVGIGSK